MNDLNRTLPDPDRLGRVNRRRFGLMALGSVGTAMAGALPSYAATPDELTLAYGVLGGNRHPWQGVITVDFDILNLIFDPLVTLDASGAVVPVLAESFERVAPDRIRFALRHGVTFHDGSPVTARDVKYSIEMAFDPMAILGFYYRSWLDHVEIVDDHTVDVVEKVPSRIALKVMGYLSFIMPEGTKIQNYTKPVGSGPYRFVEFVPNDRLVLTRNDAWWGKAPRYRTITIRQIAQPSTRIAALVAGEVDYANNIPVEDIGIIRKAGKVVETAATNRLLFLGFNRTGDTPVQKKLVRQAINYAIDKETIRKALLEGLGVPATSLIPPGFDYRDESLERYAYDPEKARALLRQAGYPNGFKTVLASPNNRYLKDSEISEVIVNQLQDVGIDAQLRLFDWSTYIAELRADRDHKTGRYPMWLWAWTSDPPDPETSFGSLLSGSAYNMAGYDNPRLMSLLAKTRVATDNETLHALFTELQDLVWNQEAQMVGLLYLPQIIGLSERLKDFKLRTDEYSRWAAL